jgi:hypothetical protein
MQDYFDPASQSVSSEVSDPHPDRLPDAVDETALAYLDAQATPKTMDESLLRATPVRDMTSTIDEAVTYLRRVDVAQLLNRQGRWDRLTGADIEAKLEFELACSSVISTLSRMRTIQQRAFALRAALDTAQCDIEEHQERLEIAIPWAKTLLAQSTNSDDFLKSRFERRLSNLIAIHLSNIQTIKQIQLSISTLKVISDRFVDVDALLIPVWQRNALAVAHSSEVLTRSGKLIVDFEMVHSQLVGTLA